VAEGLDESGSQRDLLLGGNDESQPAGKLNAHLRVRAVGDLNLDEIQVRDLPGLGDGFSSHPGSLSPWLDQIQTSRGSTYASLTFYLRGDGVKATKVAGVALLLQSATMDNSPTNFAKQNISKAKGLTAETITGAQALSLELGKAKNLLAPLDRHLKTVATK
jgi:hypothetical protein